MAGTTKYDAVIVGGGHNGLVCACYLAGAGLKVRVLEKRQTLGGCAVTEEFHPGFRNSVASYTVSLLNPQIIRELKLHEHGLRIVVRPMANFLPLPNGEKLCAFNDPGEWKHEISRFSGRDAEQMEAYYQRLETAAAFVRALVLKTPPNLGGGMLNLLRWLRLGGRLTHLSRLQQRDLFELLTKSAGDVLNDTFETEPLKALFAFDSIVGHFASPYMPGTAYVLLHHVFGEVNGRRGAWGHAIGGMGAITQAMAREAVARGVELSTDVPVSEVKVDGNKAAGVILGDGQNVDAKIVVANVNPKLLFLQLIDSAAVDAEYLSRIRGWRCSSGTFRMNVALAELPDFSCFPGKAPARHHQAGILINPSLRYMEEAYFDARLNGMSRRPVVEMLIPSTVDDTLAPRGMHVASLFCQHFNPDLPDGRSWDDVREDAADLIIDTVNGYAPNFRSAVIARQILSPLDLEREFGLIGGDIFHGALTLDQLFSARPVLGYADYRTPVKNLYLCGSGTHPGGGVTGAPGHNAAREIIKDHA